MQQQKNIFPCGALPPRFGEAFEAVARHLGFVRPERGERVQIEQGKNGLLVKKSAQGIFLRWEKPVQLYRAFSILCERWNETEFCVEERPCFETLGMMLDVSRNAVLRPESLKTMLERMALMGMDLGMMYTEDTYEIPEQPYFGWMRGRYSIAELEELDDYAAALGIELCPCIQTLGHLNRALHWPALAHLKENEEVILADDERTYAFLEEAIAAAAAPYRSRRIHIGMDEADGVGLGTHLARFGYEDPHAIIRRHLERVKAITDRLGLSAMMWSDMYFRPDSPTGDYYDSGMPSQKSMDAVVKDVTLVYWDYFHEDKADYAQMFKKHRALGAPTAFAGGIWTWAGPAADYDKTLACAVPGLEAAKEAGVPLVLATAWGDNGAEANLQTALLGMQLYAEFNYGGNCDAARLARRFEVCCGADARAFLRLSAFNTAPGMRSGPMRPVNAVKFMLYQDPLVQLYEGDTQGIAMGEHFAALEREYAAYAQASETYKPLFEFYRQLAGVLACKCEWHERIGPAVRGGDKQTAQRMTERLREAEARAKRLRASWRELWNSTNKPFGFEVIDGRMGAVCARMETACTRVQAWVEGGEAPPELLERVLPYTRTAGGALMGSYAVGEIVSACKIDV